MVLCAETRQCFASPEGPEPVERIGQAPSNTARSGGGLASDHRQPPQIAGVTGDLEKGVGRSLETGYAIVEGHEGAGC